MRALVAFLLLFALPAAAQQPPTAADLARDLQRRYERVRDFSADFEHVYEGGVLGKKVIERGTLLVKTPGKFRWTYTSPEKKEFVSDGRTLYSYIPEDRQVIVSQVPPADDASSPAMFLAGKGNILRDFTPTLAALPAIAPSEVALRLVPTRPQRDYDGIILVLDRASLQIRSLVTTDAQGGTSTFVFTRLRENLGLPDKDFVFKVPRGVDVINDSTKR